MFDALSPQADAAKEQSQIMQQIVSLGTQNVHMVYAASTLMKDFKNDIPGFSAQLAYPDDLYIKGLEDVHATELGFPPEHILTEQRDPLISPFEVWFGELIKLYPGTRGEADTLYKWGGIQLGTGSQFKLISEINPDFRETQPEVIKGLEQQLVRIASILSGRGPAVYVLKDSPQDLYYSHLAQQIRPETYAPRVKADKFLAGKLSSRGQDLGLAGRAIQAMQQQNVLQEFFLSPALAVRHLVAEILGRDISLPLSTTGYFKSTGQGDVDLVLRSTLKDGAIRAILNCGNGRLTYPQEPDREIKNRIWQAFNAYSMAGSIVE